MDITPVTPVTPDGDNLVSLTTAASEADMATALLFSLFRNTVTHSDANTDGGSDASETGDVACINKLDDQQKEVVINAWGHLKRTNTALDKALRGDAKGRNINELNKICLDEIFRLRLLLLKGNKKNALLKDLLVNELNRSETLERDMSNTNDIMNTMSSTITLVKRRHQALEDDHRKVKARLSKMEADGSCSASMDGSVQTNDEDTVEPEPSYIGRYLYKSFPPDGHFVGYVVSYKKPYYKVVYEDGDMEDMVRKEVLHFWVSASNLSAQKKILCQRTAKASTGVSLTAPKHERVQLK
jgi:hypothetical protein